MLLSTALRVEPRASVTWSPLDDRWYSSDLMQSETGLMLTADNIMRCGTVLAAVRFLADAYSMCPPKVGIRVSDSESRMDPKHYAQRVLRNPNAWQTGFRWRHISMTWASTWGNSYNRILGGVNAFVDELRPLHPGRMRVVDQRADGTLIYEYRPPKGGQPVPLGQEEILHYRGISLDGISGAPMYQLIRNAVGIALLAERHTSTFLRKGNRLAGLLVPANTLGETGRKQLGDSWNEAFGGANHTGTVGVLPFGVDFKAVAMDNQKAQLVELSDRQVGEILRFLGVPGVVVGWMGDKTSTYASADAFFEKGGIKHSLMPWIMNFEQEEEKALLVDDGQDRFIRHNLDVLLRANTKDQYEALFKATGRPWQTGNETRRILDLNPISDDPSMDTVAEAANAAGGANSSGGAGSTGPAGADNPSPEDQPPPPPPPRKAVKPAPGDDTAGAELLWQFATDVAARMVRREIAAVRGGHGSRGAAVRYARDPAGFKAWATEFYADHAGHIANALHIPEATARAYADRQRDGLLAGGIAVIEAWERDVVPRLAALAMDALAGPAPKGAAPPATGAPAVNLTAEIHTPSPRVTIEPTIIVERPAPKGARHVKIERDGKGQASGFLIEEE